MTCRRTITPASSITPRMLRTLYPISCLQKPKSELKEIRNDSLSCNSLILSVQQSHIICATGTLYSTGVYISRATSGSGSFASCATILHFRVVMCCFKYILLGDDLLCTYMLWSHGCLVTCLPSHMSAY